MPFTAPSIYAPGTVDLLGLIQQSKNGASGLKRVLQPDSQDPLNEGPGIGPSSASAAAGTGTAQSAAVGNAVGSAVGNAVMGAVIGPIGMAAASALGLAPQSAISQAVAAAHNAVANMNSISVNPSQAGITAASQDSDPDVNGTVLDAVGGDATGFDAPDTGTADGGVSAGNAADSGSSEGGEMAKGGIIRGKGTSTSDSINIKASDGEYMLPAHVVEAIGKPFLDRLVSSIPNVLGGNQGEGK